MPARVSSHDIRLNNDGEWWVDPLDNRVLVIGPSAEVNSFKHFFIDHGKPRGAMKTRPRLLLDHVLPVPRGLRGMDRREWQNDNWGCDHEPWNVAIEAAADPWTLSFSFDTGGGFPKPIFDRIAEIFPRLAFYCFSLEQNDRYLEYGWFNPPHGCQYFHEVDLEEDAMPFTNLGVVRDPISELRHQAAIEQFRDAAKQAEGDLR